MTSCSGTVKFSVARVPAEKTTSKISKSAYGSFSEMEFKPRLKFKLQLERWRKRITGYTHYWQSMVYLQWRSKNIWIAAGSLPVASIRR
jgi:hypothetical protein